MTNVWSVAISWDLGTDCLSVARLCSSANVRLALGMEAQPDIPDFSVSRKTFFIFPLY